MSATRFYHMGMLYEVPMAWGIWDAFRDHDRYLPHRFFEFGNGYLGFDDFVDVDRLFEFDFNHGSDRLFVIFLNFNFPLNILGNFFLHLNRSLYHHICIDNCGNVNHFLLCD